MIRSVNGILKRTAARSFAVVLAAFGFAAPLQAGEIAVYTQVWRGKAPHSYEKPSGKGYVLIDFENKTVTRISTYRTSLGLKYFRIENYTTTVFAEYTDRKKASDALAIQGSRQSGSSSLVWERFIAFRGVKSLLPLGPSQQKQIPKTVSGIRRMTQEWYPGAVEEDNFSARFNRQLTHDANANSRTLEAQVELLATSLEEAGWNRTGTE